MMTYVFTRPKTVLGIIFLITAILIPFALKVKPMNSIESTAIDDDPANVAIREVQETFGVSEETISIALKGEESLLSSSGIQFIRDLTQSMSEVDRVDRVLSLTSLTGLEVTSSEIRAFRLIPEGISNLSDSEKEKLKANRLYGKLFLSEDEKVSFIVLQFEPIGKDQLIRDKMIRNFYERLEDFSGRGIELIPNGSTLFMYEMNRRINRDNMTVFPFTLLILVGLLYVVYRRKSFVLMPFVVTILSVVWVIGFMGIFWKHLTGYTALVPLVLLTICLCDTVHILNAIWKETLYAGEGSESIDILKRGIKKTLFPCFLTSVTTSIGFFALMTSGMDAIQDMGAFIGLGVIFAFLLSISLVPIALSHVTLNKGEKLNRSFYFFSNAMGSLGNYVATHSKRVLFVSLTLVALAALGIPRLQVGQSCWGDVQGKNGF